MDIHDLVKLYTEYENEQYYKPRKEQDYLFESFVQWLRNNKP